MHSMAAVAIFGKVAGSTVSTVLKLALMKGLDALETQYGGKRPCGHDANQTRPSSEGTMISDTLKTPFPRPHRTMCTRESRPCR